MPILNLTCIKRPTQAQSLPTEIWLEIASYLSDEVIQELYGFNRVFYQLSMKIRYKELVIRSFTKKEISKLLCLSKDSSLASRIISLDIDLRAFVELVDSKTTWPQRIESAIRRFPGRDLSAITGTINSRDQVVSTVVDTLAQAARIRHFHIRMDSEEVLQSNLSLLLVLWITLCQRIDSLALDVYSGGVDLVSQTLGDLSSLQHLAITLRDEHTQPKSWDMTSSPGIARLLSTASGTLESLSLKSSFVTSIPGLRLSLRKLVPLSRLRRVHLDIPFDDITGLAAAQFLNTHSTIEELTLIPYFSIHSDLTPISAICLPSLLKLTLHLNLQSNQYFRFWGGILSFIQLSHLTIHSSVVSKNHILVTCDAFRRSGNGRWLRYLTVDSQLVPWDTLDAIARTFPCLHALSIRAKYISSDNEGTTWDLPLFAARMSERQYLQWTLYDLTLIQPGDDPSTRLKTTSYQAMQTAANSIPSLRSFCGWGCMDPPYRLMDA